MPTISAAFRVSKLTICMFIMWFLASCIQRPQNKVAKAKIDTVNILSLVSSYPKNGLNFINSGEQLGNERPLDSIVAPNSKWKGIFDHAGSFLVEDVKVGVSRLPDSATTIYDIVVKTNKKDRDILMVSGNAGLLDGRVGAIDKVMTYMLPGKDIKFTYKHNNYVLHATGKIVKINPRKDVTIGVSVGNVENVINYNLYIRGFAKGHYFNQLLVHIDSYEGGFSTQIIFAGDLDGDNIPDFIINDNSYSPGWAATLFLSKMAGPKRLLIDVGGTATDD